MVSMAHVSYGVEGKAVSLDIDRKEVGIVENGQGRSVQYDMLLYTPGLQDGTKARIHRARNNHFKDLQCLH